MSKAKLHVSAALEIPTYWTPEQALAVYELVDTLRDKIWLTYSSDVAPPGVPGEIRWLKIVSINPPLVAP